MQLYFSKKGHNGAPQPSVYTVYNWSHLLKLNFTEAENYDSSDYNLLGKLRNNFLKSHPECEVIMNLTDVGSSDNADASSESESPYCHCTGDIDIDGYCEYCVTGYY